MRRADREVSDKKKINDIISKCDSCRIGFNDNGEVYIVPLSFGYVYDNEKYIFYFHSAKSGRKIDLIRQNPLVGFEMDTGYKLNKADTACAFSAGYKSVVGTGTISIVSDINEKKRGLLSIMEHNTGRADWTFEDKMTEKVCIFKMCVNALSCKEHT